MRAFRPDGFSRDGVDTNLQRKVGGATLTDASASSTAGKPGASTLTEHLPVSAGANDVPHRAQMESAFGEDFSSVQAFTGQHDAMSRMGASAAAHGNSVAFADSSPSPWLVAHELTHVVQNQRAGGGSGISMKAMFGAS